MLLDKKSEELLNGSTRSSTSSGVHTPKKLLNSGGEVWMFNVVTLPVSTAAWCLCVNVVVVHSVTNVWGGTVVGISLPASVVPTIIQQ